METPAANRKARQSAATREAILSACLRLFAQRGVASTSMDEIARCVGLTKGAIYWHFESKEALFAAILERIRDRWKAAVFTPVCAGTDPAARLECLFDGYRTLLAEAPEICLFLQRVLLEGDSEFSPRVGLVFRQTARFIARILAAGQAGGQFRKDLKPLVAAHMVVGALTGANQQRLANRTLALPALIEETRQAILARVRAK